MPIHFQSHPSHTISLFPFDIIMSFLMSCYVMSCHVVKTNIKKMSTVFNKITWLDTQVVTREDLKSSASGRGSSNLSPVASFFFLHFLSLFLHVLLLFTCSSILPCSLSIHTPIDTHRSTHYEAIHATDIWWGITTRINLFTMYIPYSTHFTQ